MKFINHDDYLEHVRVWVDGCITWAIVVHPARGERVGDMYITEYYGPDATDTTKAFKKMPENWVWV